MKKFAVIGYPIGHTMSPFIHNMYFSLKNIDAEYGKLSIAPEDLSSSVNKELSALAGFNVTIPHKQSIIPLLDEIDPVAAEYGAVNTVFNKDGRLLGFNTDAYGFLEGLRTAGLSLDGRVLVYGFGGAARTIITESLKAGCEVTIGTTAELKSLALPVAKEFSDKFGKEVSVLQNEEIEKEYDLLINASPVGMYPKYDAMPIERSQIGLFGGIYDIVYNPEPTKLLAEAKKQGILCGGGLSMLVCQAEKAQTIWHKVEFSPLERAAVLSAVAKKQNEDFPL